MAIKSNEIEVTFKSKIIEKTSSGATKESYSTGINIDISIYKNSSTAYTNNAKYIESTHTAITDHTGIKIGDRIETGTTIYNVTDVTSVKRTVLLLKVISNG